MHVEVAYAGGKAVESIGSNIGEIWLLPHSQLPHQNKGLVHEMPTAIVSIITLQ